ncbi:hypothetical protein DS62_11710 [Smithella sp. SC_K08D17]|nr:hypothetical protein KD27_06810 [Smithella sp. D17]KIE18331.1 hypothetical protein DS62_11710 [Smithella sp. SC_K08D17]
MRRKVRIIAAVIFCILSVVAFLAQAENQRASVNEGGKKIIVEIDYGNNRPSRTVEIPLVKGKTFLDVLQTVATVETHPVGQYVFVTSIDGVAGKRGEMAWYYTIDGKSPGELAYSKVVDGAQRMKWIYKKDVCSWKVDSKLNPQKEGGKQK